MGTLAVTLGFAALLYILWKDGNKPKEALHASTSTQMGSSLDFSSPSTKDQETHDEYVSRKKKESVEWAKSLLDNRHKYIILDTETTGLGDNDVIIQLAIIDLDGKVLMDTLVKPKLRKRINPEATAIHGIRMADLKDAPMISDIIEELDSIFKGKHLIIYNAEYDARLLIQSMRQDGIIHFPEYTADCAMVYYSEFVGQWSPYHNEFKFQKLPGGDHTAVGDCRATLEVIKKMAMADELV